MKRFLFALVITAATLSVYAQDERIEEPEKTGGFKKDMLFTGGNLNLGFYGGVTVLGANPQLGYSVANWLDAGISFGYTYTSQHDDLGNRYKQSLFSPGAFVRIFPVDFLYASVQFEHNFIKNKAVYTNSYEYKESLNAASLLLGIGYTSGKEGRNTPYYFFSISLDVLGNPNSPYRDVVFTQIAEPPGYKAILNDPYPVIKAGFNIPLFQGRGRRR